MATLPDIQSIHSELIRKTLNLSVFIADYPGGDVSNAVLFDVASGALKDSPLPAGYLDLGFLPTAGPTLSRALEQSSLSSLQSLSPTRVDPTSDTITLQVVGQETNKATIAVGAGMKLSDVTTAANGAVEFDKPTVPVINYYSALLLGQDSNIAAGPAYIGAWLPKVQITTYGDQAFGRGDDPVLTQFTLTALYDSVAGTDFRRIYGGEGFKSLAAAMGFDDESSSSSS